MPWATFEQWWQITYGLSLKEKNLIFFAILKKKNWFLLQLLDFLKCCFHLRFLFWLGSANDYCFASIFLKSFLLHHGKVGHRNYYISLHIVFSLRICLAVESHHWNLLLITSSFSLSRTLPLISSKLLSHTGSWNYYSFKITTTE